MTMKMHELPVVEVYKGVEIFGLQSAERIAIAKKQIREVIGLSTPRALYDFAVDYSKSPEARLLAKTKAIASRKEHQRAGFNVDVLIARTQGIECVAWCVARCIACRDGNWPEAWDPFLIDGGE